MDLLQTSQQYSTVVHALNLWNAVQYFWWEWSSDVLSHAVTPPSLNLLPLSIITKCVVKVLSNFFLKGNELFFSVTRLDFNMTNPSFQLWLLLMLRLLCLQQSYRNVVPWKTACDSVAYRTTLSSNNLRLVYLLMSLSLSHWCEGILAHSSLPSFSISLRFAGNCLCTAPTGLSTHI